MPIPCPSIPGSPSIASGAACAWFAVPGDVVPAAEAPAVRVRPRLLKSYVHSLSTSKSAVIVLEATYVAADGSSTVRTYRGQYVAMNWASGTGETIAAFRMAGASCVRQVQVELEKMLRQ